MLLQLITSHPEAIGSIVRSTPTWVWGLFGGLVALGASQLRGRTASLARVSLLPIAMTIFSVWGTFSVTEEPLTFPYQVSVPILRVIPPELLVVPPRSPWLVFTCSCGVVPEMVASW